MIKFSPTRVMPDLFLGEIKRLMIVAGPSGSGKTTFLDDPKRRIDQTMIPSELADLFELAGKHQTVRGMSAMTVPRFEQLCLHVDLMAPIRKLRHHMPNTRQELADFIRAEMYHDWKELKAYAGRAQIVDVMTFFVRRKENHMRWRARDLMIPHAPVGRRLALAIHGDASENSELHRALYKAWVAFCDDLAPRSRHVLDANASKYAFISDAAFNAEIDDGYMDE